MTNVIIQNRCLFMESIAVKILLLDEPAVINCSLACTRPVCLKANDMTNVLLMTETQFSSALELDW